MKCPNNRDIELYLGAVPLRDGSTFFRVWAPYAGTISVEVGEGPDTFRVPLTCSRGDYFEGTVENVRHGDLYRYIIDAAAAFPDPASRSQPRGVHGPSGIVDHNVFPWRDARWQGVPLEEYVIYELHVGAFTREGTFEALRGCLEYVKDLGVNAIELMPVAQFPGERNWGYDGVFPFAVQHSYGGPEGLKALVDDCHGHGISVILDVVFNHLGPEGNYLGSYGPYFTDRYRAPWGDAINFDGPMSDEVRRFFIASALAWFSDYHIDALRIDAIHGIFDFSARTFLQDLAAEVKDRGRDTGKPFFLMAESDLNDIRVVTPQKKGGIGFDAQWNDDFHHALHTLLTGEQGGYYRDFGALADLAKACREGYVYTGQYSRYRRRRHGSPSKHVPPGRFVVFSQNHDQVGNRARGDRLGSLVPAAKLRVAAVAVLLSPFIPLLFMGEEYGERAPFHYFVSHSDEKLIDAVRTGRREEFLSFEWNEDIPDPQARQTYLESKVDRETGLTGAFPPLYDLYRHLIGLRRSLRFSDMKKKRPSSRSFCGNKALRVIMPLATGAIACFFNFSDDEVSIPSPLPPGSWSKVVDTGSPRWGGEGETAPGVVKQPAPGADAPLFRIGPFNAAVYRNDG